MVHGEIQPWVCIREATDTHRKCGQDWITPFELVRSDFQMQERPSGDKASSGLPHQECSILDDHIALQRKRVCVCICVCTCVCAHVCVLGSIDVKLVLRYRQHEIPQTYTYRALKIIVHFFPPFAEDETFSL